LPRLYLAWVTPELYANDDADLDLLGDVLAGGKASRLYRRLVYDDRIATEVAAYQNSREAGGTFQVVATAVPGVTLDTKGRILVDAQFHTSAPHVYAAGDVIGNPALASVSMEQGRVAMCHAFGLPYKTSINSLTVLSDANGWDVSGPNGQTITLVSGNLTRLDGPAVEPNVTLNVDINQGATGEWPYLLMLNPSISTYHMECVDKSCKTVEQALAWRNSMDKYTPPEVLT
jgi:hypothetical protein